jgi:O-antigen/teichoic acid export membrane protein
MGNLAKKLIQGSFLRVLNLFTSIGATFLITPFVISTIGDRWYGLWILASSFVVYYSFFDLGLSQAVQRFISQALGAGDHEEANRVFNTCLFLFIAAGSAILAVSVTLAALSAYFARTPAEIPVFRLVIVLIGLDTAASFPIRAFDGYLYAHVRYDVGNIVELVKVIVRTALIFLFLQNMDHGAGVVALSIISVVTALAEYSLCVVIVLKLYPAIKVRFSYFTKARLRALLSYSIYSFVSNVADRLRFQIDTIIISAFLGLGLVTHYNIGSRFGQYHMMLISSAIALMMPVFSKFEAQKDYDQIRNSFLFVTKLNTILAVFIGGGIIVFGKPFIVRWMGPEYVDAYDVMLVMTIGLIFNTAQTTAKTLLQGLSRHRAYAVIVTVETAVKIALTIALIKPLGITGAALGTTIPTILSNAIAIPIYAARAVRIGYWYYVKSQLRVVALNAVMLGSAWLALRNYLTPDYLRLFLAGGVVSLAVLAANGFALLTKNERAYFGVPI